MDTNSGTGQNQSSLGNIIYTLRPILALEEIVGIFRFRRKEKQLLPTDNKTKLIAIFRVALIVVVYIADVYIYSILSTSLIGYCATSLIFYTGSMVIHTILYSPVNVQIIKRFANIDDSLQLNLRENFYKQSRNYIFFIIFSVISINMLFSTWYYFNNTTSIIDVVITSCLYYLPDIEITFVCVMIYLLKFRLAVLNQSLRKLIRNNEITQKIGLVWNTNTRRRLQPFPLSKLRELSQIYSVFGETCSLINGLCNFQILMSLINNFIVIIVTLWVLVFYYRTGGDSNRVIANMIVFSGFKLSFVMILSYVCESLLRARDESMQLVNELVMDYELCADARAQAKAFMRLLDACPLRVTVYHILTVDITLMLKFVSASTTYLIILIQISHFD